MSVYSCKIYTRFLIDGKPQEKVLFQCQTTAMSPEQACNNAWYRAAIANRWVNPRKHKGIELTTKLSKFRREYEKNWNYRCQARESQQYLPFDETLDRILRYFE